MIKVALKGLAGRKVRALLTALAVVIGVSMVSGTFVLTDTMKKAFDGIFTESYEGTDAVINGKQLVEFSSGGRATVDASLLEKVSSLESVEAAAGSLQDLQNNSNSAKLLDRDGQIIGRQGDTLGVGIDDAGRQFSPLELKQGEWPRGDGEIVLDAGTASKHGFGVGDTIRAAGSGPAKPFTVTGVASYGSVDSLGGASLAVFDLPTAQELFAKQGQYDSISVKAADGVTPEALTREIQPLLPASAEVKTGAAQAEADSKDTNESLKFITYFLLGFGGIALFVGAFVILNTLSITVAQRSREFATLRTLGASRRQVMRSVVLEGLVVGVVASVLGLVLGLGIAKGMSALFAAMGLDLPESGTVLQSRTIIVSLLTGTVVTLVASVVPALRATRVPPISAVREGSTATQAGPGRKPYSAAAVVGVSLASLGIGLFGGVSGGLVALTLAVGVLTLFVGIAMLAPRLVKPIAALVGLPAARLGGSAGRLARENSVRNPGRTASTAAALMIGLALVTFVAMIGSGLRTSTVDSVKQQVDADYVVTAKEGGGSFPAASDKAIAGAEGVERISGVRADTGMVAGEETRVSGIDPASIGRFYNYTWTHGSLAGMDDRGAIVSDRYAAQHSLKVGSPLTVQSSSGEKLAVRVTGIYDAPNMDALLGDVSISQTAFDGAFARPQNQFTFVAGSSEAALAGSIGDYPDAKLTTETEFTKSRTDGLAMILKLLYVLLGFSVVVSLFGMVNTLVLAVYERTRELGMLRAVGMTRRQARRMIRHESIITALIGAAMGIPLGIFLSALVTQALSEYGIGMSLPAAELVAFTTVAVIAGVLAAIVPARRASRIDVLNALQYE
jgi:putative ABC transport system permease protein